MKTIKRVISMALVLCLILTLCIAASATDTDALYTIKLADGTECETKEIEYGGVTWKVAVVPENTDTILVNRKSTEIVAVIDYNSAYGISASDYTSGWWTTWEGASFDDATQCFTIPLNVMEDGSGEAKGMGLSEDNTYYKAYPLNGSSFALMYMMIQVGGTLSGNDPEEPE